MKSLEFLGKNPVDAFSTVTKSCQSLNTFVIFGFLQVEYHPHYLQEELKLSCESQGIHLQAYSSLGTTVKESPLLQDPVVACVARKYSASPAQVLLRWATQQGIG